MGTREEEGSFLYIHCIIVCSIHVRNCFSQYWRKKVFFCCYFQELINLILQLVNKSWKHKLLLEICCPIMFIGNTMSQGILLTNQEINWKVDMRKAVRHPLIILLYTLIFNLNTICLNRTQRRCSSDPDKLLSSSTPIAANVGQWGRRTFNIVCSASGEPYQFRASSQSWQDLRRHS